MRRRRHAHTHSTASAIRERAGSLSWNIRARSQIVERMAQTGGLSADRASSLITLLNAIEFAASDSTDCVAFFWIVDRLVPAVASLLAV